MRKLLFLLLFVPLFLSAQEPDYIPNIQVDTGAHKIDFRGVVETPGISKTKLLNRAKDWVNRNYDMIFAVVTMCDESSGHLIARARVFGSHPRGLITITAPYELSYTIDIRCKDGKYRYEITDFDEVDGVNGLFPNAYSADRFVNDPAFRNRKGEFDKTSKAHLYFIEGNANNTIVQIKAALTTEKFDHPVESDF